MFVMAWFLLFFFGLLLFQSTLAWLEKAPKMVWFWWCYYVEIGVVAISLGILFGGLFQ
jgi:hypothetical protein